MVHLAIEQHVCRIAQQALGPEGNEQRSQHPHQRVQPPPAQPQRRSQRGDGQYRGQRIGEHVQIGSAQVQVRRRAMRVTARGRMGMRCAVGVRVLVPLLVTLLRGMRMATGSAMQQPGRHQVHQQADHGHFQGRLRRQRLGAPQAQRRLDANAHGHQHQHKGAGEAAQHFNLPAAEGVACIVGVATRQGKGQGRHAQRQGMRPHVPAVGQQGHGAAPPAHRDFQHHGHQGQCQHPARARLALPVAAVKAVTVAPGFEVVGMACHGLQA